MNWVDCQIKDVLELAYGKSLPERNRKDGVVPVYGSGGVGGYHSVPLVEGPGIIVGRKGTVGSVYFEKNDFFPIDTVYFVRPFIEKISLEYSYYLLKNLPLASLNSDAAVPGLNRDRAYSLSIKLPNLDQQNHIVKFLRCYDDLIDNNYRRIQLLEESARLLYREWFVHLRFPGHEQTNIIDGVPEGWEKKQLSELCMDIRETVKPNVINPETPYIGLEHIPRKSITLVDWDSAEKVTSNKFLFQKSDIIFGKIRPYFHKVGFAICDGITSSDAIVIRALDEFYYQYLLMYLSSDYFVALASKTCKEGSKMPRADWKYLQSTDVLVPRDLLLEQFSKQINMIISQLEALAKYNKSLIKARDLLLPKLMNGELAV